MTLLMLACSGGNKHGTQKKRLCPGTNGFTEASHTWPLCGPRQKLASYQFRKCCRQAQLPLRREQRITFPTSPEFAMPANLLAGSL